MSSAAGILKNLTLEEKIRLLNGVGSWNTFDCNSKLPVISMSDGPHGLRHQTGKENYTNINQSNVATCFPTASAIASSWNCESAFKMGNAIAKEARAENVQIMLGPGMNIKRSPLCGRNFEYFSEDPLLSGKIAAAYVKGMQNQKVGACIKHFALNNQEKNRQSSSSNVDERTLREIYLKGFEIAVKDSNPCAVMSSYNLINGKYASANEHLLTEILRDEWGFGGIVISDWGANMNPGQSLKAGLDIGMPDSKGYFAKRIKADLDAGILTEADIDKACERIIKTALVYGKNQDAPGSTSTVNSASSTSYEHLEVDYDEQHKIALELALDSAVLLKNDGILPLKSESKQQVVAIGTFARDVRFQGGGSSHISTKKYPNIIEEIAKDYDVAFEPDYNSRALALVKCQLEQNPQVPVLYFCGLPDSSEGEGFDRIDLSLPSEQIQLYKQIRALTKKIVLVTFGGSPFDLSFALKPENQAGAILHMYLCGQACAKACAMLLSGKSNPCGKLAETWPLENDYIKPTKDFDINYKEGVLAGYRYYETKNRPVLFEFGYGLSYTDFEYSDLRIEKNSLFKVSVSIKNTGNLAGAEIVQLYVKNPVELSASDNSEFSDTSKSSDSAENSISRPSIELRDFAKIFLQPGQKQTVTFILKEEAFCVYSDKKNAFSIVGGEYQICIGSSIRQLKLTEKVNVSGDSLFTLVSPDSTLQKKVFTHHERHKKGEFDGSDCLGLMATQSHFISGLLKILRFFLVITSKSKSSQDPAVKIMISGLQENPLESFISTAPEVFSERLVNFLVKRANSGGRKWKN